MRVHIPQPAAEGFLEHLRRGLGTDVELVDARPYDVLVEGVPDREQLEGCRAVVIPYAGVPRKTRELVASLDGVALYNLHHNAAATAELAIGLLLAAARRILPLDRDLRAGDWRARYGDARDVLLRGRTALVIGHGAIGGYVAEACRGLGMDVLTMRRGDGPRLHELLPRAQAVVVCVPWTRETEGLIGADELALLRDGALLVNISRGPVVDEKALYDALASGRIAAGLDVWYAYPKSEEERSCTEPSAFPFRELDNVVMSPHRGGLVDTTEQMRAAHLADVLNALAQGEQPASRIDLDAEY